MSESKNKNGISQDLANELVTGVAGKPISIEEDTFTTTLIGDGTRNALCIGLGGGGSSIMSEVGASLTNAMTICYDTSARGRGRVQADVHLSPPGMVDGSGRVRLASKNVFKNAYDRLLAAIEDLTQNTTIDYCLIFTSTAGGTGSGISPMVARIVKEKFEFKTIVFGAYPTMKEDAVSLLNAIEWQTEIEKVDVPYILYDNNRIDGLSSPEIHNSVNAEIVRACQVICGETFSDNAEMNIDNQDMANLTTLSGRISVYYSTEPMKSTDTLDSYLSTVIGKSACIEPDKLKGTALFIKGPKSQLGKLDTALSVYHDTYGKGLVDYKHIEYSDSFAVALIAAGSNIPTDRLVDMKGIYDDIQTTIAKDTTVTSDILGEATNPLLNNMKRGNKGRDSFNIDNVFNDLI